jgi:hypothetical protein
MREEGVSALLSKAASDWGTVERLIAEKRLIEIEYQGKMFYMRKLLSRVGR